MTICMDNKDVCHDEKNMDHGRGIIGNVAIYFNGRNQSNQMRTKVAWQLDIPPSPEGQKV